MFAGSLPGQTNTPPFLALQTAGVALPATARNALPLFLSPAVKRASALTSNDAHHDFQGGMNLVRIKEITLGAPCENVGFPWFS